MRITASAVASTRAQLLEAQGGRCSLCGDPADNPCLDHDHKTGHIRDVLCRGCNAMLGHLENNRPRHKLTNDTKFARFLSNVAGYLMRHRAYPRSLLHPTHRTEDEKRVLRNERARVARARKKDE